MTGKKVTRPPATRSAERSAHGTNAPVAGSGAQRPYRTRTQGIVATLMAPLAALAFAGLLSAPANALTLQEQGWQVANSKCNGGDAKQCELRDRLSEALKRKGCAFQEDGGWWKCSRAH
jgi:invasion protein IalB